MGLRVVQWTTGNVGQRSVRAVVAHPDLELVGCYAWSTDKVGRDVGELCGIDPVGVTATDDVDALLALEPDAVVYNPMWPDVDELVRILEAGVNVVSTAAFINGRGLGAGHDRILKACEQGGSSMFGTGISPGFVELIAIATAGICDRIDKITDQRGIRHHPLRLARHRAALRLRPADRRPRAAGDGGPGHRGVRRGRRHGRRRPRGRARRDRLRGRVRPGHRGRRDGLVDDRRGLRRRGRRQLAGQGRRPHRRRAERPVAEGPDPRSRLDDRGGPRHPGRRTAHREGHARVPARRRTSRPPPSPTSWCSG